MSFFIRNKSKGPSQGNFKKRKNNRLDVPDQKKKKKPFGKKFEKKNDEDEEISSEDEVMDTDKFLGEEEEDVRMTAQETKLELAKKYLVEIEKEERERLEKNEVDNQAILNRLREGVLEQAGKLKKQVGDKIKTEIKEEDIRVLRCKAHKLSITCVVVSHDSKHLYSASKDCSIVKWCLTEGKKIKSILPKHKCKTNTHSHSSPVLALAVSHDNKYLASGGKEKEIHIWDPESLEHMHTFVGHRDAITGLAFCRFTHTLYSCSSDKTVRLWTVVEKSYIETLFGHQAGVTGIDSLSRGRAVTSGGTDDSLRVWKIQEESQLIFNGHSRSVDSVKRLTDQNFLSGGDDGEVCVWSVFKKKPLHTIKNAHGTDPTTGEPNWIVGLAALANSEVFATGSSDGFLRVWACEPNLRAASQLLEIPVPGFLNALAFSPDEKLLVAAVGQEHRLGRWNKIKEAKNSIVVVNIRRPEPE